MLGKGHGGLSRKFRWNGFPEVPGSLGGLETPEGLLDSGGKYEEFHEV